MRFTISYAEDGFLVRPINSPIFFAAKFIACHIIIPSPRKLIDNRPGNIQKIYVYFDKTPRAITEYPVIIKPRLLY